MSKTGGQSMDEWISRLVEYAFLQGWIKEFDRVWASNRIAEAMGRIRFRG